MKKHKPLTLGLVLIASMSHGLFRSIPTAEIHISRFVSNLEKKSEANPNDADLHYQIGRLYAMSYANESETLPVEAEYAPIFDDDSELEKYDGNALYSTIVDYDLNSSFRKPPPVSSQLDPRNMNPREDLSEEEKRRHTEAFIKRRTKAIPFLDKAIKRYKKALDLAPKNIVYQLGYAWAIDQSGDATNAIPIYRNLLKELVETYSTNQRRGNKYLVEQIVHETSGYLSSLIGPSTPDFEEMKKLCEWAEDEVPSPGYAITPIAIPLTADVKLTDIQSTSARIHFDLDGLNRGGAWSWITSDAGWLVWDPDQTGRIESGRQLFGNVTFWVFWENGYDALAALDDNQNNSIEDDELIGLAIWRDANSNGISEPGEVRPVAEWGITALACTHEPHESGIPWSPRGIMLKSGEFRPTYDVMLTPAIPEHR